jgi:site-specific recombinase XerD
MTRSTFKVLFYLKRDKQKANGLIPLFCRITVDGQEVRFGMKCDVNPKFWDVKAGKASGRTTEAMKINSLIENTKAAIFKIYRELQERDNYVTAEKVRNVFLGTEIKQQTLLELLDTHNRERKLLIGVSICQWNYGSYCRTRERLSDFIRQWYNVSDIPIREIDHRFICDFEAYLTVNYRPAHNTLTKYLKNLRHIIEIAIEKNYISKNPFVNFRMQYQNPDRGFLTQEEVEKLIAFQFDDEKLEQARDVFVFCCFTGLSYSDAFYLTKENIQLSFGGKMWIKGRRQKTDTEYNIPLLNIPKLILEKYEKRQQGNQLLPVGYLQAYNGLLKKIAKICGIDKNMSSHVSRHTFASLITLSEGVPVETVSRMLGHEHIKTTQRYAELSIDKIREDMNNLSARIAGEFTLVI